MKRFVIVGLARTGTTMVVQMLDSHPRIACYGEILNPDRVVDGERLVTPAILERLFRIGVELTWPGDKQGRADIRMNVSRHGGDVDAAGFKILERQWRDDDATRYLVGERDIHVISVRRRNLLGTLVSLLNAGKRGIYNSTRASDAVTEPIRISLDQLAQLTQRERAWEERTRAAFAGHPWFEIAYEDLVADTPQAGRSLQAFLGVEPHSLTVDVIKLGLPLPLAIENFQELAVQARGSEYERFFEDANG